jgi:hypothetical protein
VNHLELRGLRVGRARVDLSFDSRDGTTRVTVDRVEGELDVRVDSG